jgi:hypothetical protein
VDDGSFSWPIVIGVFAVLAAFAVLWFGFIARRPRSAEPALVLMARDYSDAAQCLLFALPAPLSTRRPSDPGEIAAVSHADPQTGLAGLALAPGEYWVYLVELEQAPANLVHAIDLIWQRLRAPDRPLEPLAGSPFVVAARA